MRHVTVWKQNFKIKVGVNFDNNTLKNIPM